MTWSRLFSNIKSVQHNEKLYTWVLNMVTDKLKKQGVPYRVLPFDKVYPLDYSEYKINVYFILLRLHEHYTPHIGRSNEDALKLKTELLNIIMDMDVVMILIIEKKMIFMSAIMLMMM